MQQESAARRLLPEKDVFTQVIAARFTENSVIPLSDVLRWFLWHAWGRGEKDGQASGRTRARIRFHALR